ncbi:MAG: Wzt carbohydrate-binding domain-containing protein [Armatimonadetes bacterium]|nr:Wzt carbohydrate-binding domain-containing protein [Armatimonadota bacterium]
MRQGCLVMDGETPEVVKEYLSYLSDGAKAAFENNPERSGNGWLRLTGARVLDRRGQPARHLIAGEPVSFEFTYLNRSAKKNADVNATIYNHLGIAVTNFSTAINQFMIDDLGSQGKFVCRIPNLPLPIGQYRVAAAVQMEGMSADLIPNALVFDVVSSIFYKNGRCPRINYCACMVENEWQHDASEAVK